MDRRLAAIVIADVVDYSRLMGEDQTRMLAALRELRQNLFDPFVAEHRGKIVKRMGDGWIVEFASVSDAVNCSLKIQNGLSGHKEVRLRIGIHIGEIVIEAEDLFGDGINVAARLEALAEPGTILISDTAHNSLDGKAAEQFQGGETHKLKNIARPVKVWGWTGKNASTSKAETRGVIQTPDKISIAVLPFNNMSGDAEQEYFADGISEDIITDLSQINNLLVIARNSTFVYKGHAVDIPTVAKELGVQYVLEGSIRRGGNRVRINAQLIDAGTGGHLWAERYDRDLTDIFELQDEVTANIVNALAVTLRGDEQRRVGKKWTNNLAAYELVLHARELVNKTQNKNHPEVRDLLYKAIELDPYYGTPYAYLTLMNLMNYFNGWTDDPQSTLEEAYSYAKKGVDLAPDAPLNHIALGGTHLLLRQHDKAIAEAERAVQLDPNYAYALFELGWFLHYAGQANESLPYFEKAVRLDPHHSDHFFHFMAAAYFQLGRFEEAADLSRQRIARSPKSDVSRMLLASCYGYLEKMDEARVLWDELKKINPEFSIEQRRKVQPYKNPEDFEKIVTGLKKAGLID